MDSRWYTSYFHVFIIDV